MRVVAPPDTLDRAGLRRVLVTLCVTVTVSYGVLYYAFPVLATDISADTGWSHTSLTAAFSTGLLLAAVAGIPAGRWVDRRGPRGLMTGGSLLAGPAIVLIALAPNLVIFFVGWIMAGVSMGAVFYPPAFTALTRWHGAERVKALTMLTLAAGFASTIFAPATAALLDRLGWRGSYLVLGAVLVAITIPGHWRGLRGPWPASPRVVKHDREDPVEPRPNPLTDTPGADPLTDTPGADPIADQTGDPARIARSLPFASLVIAMGLATFAGLAVVINLVPMLVTERGIDTGTAALVLGLGGAGQVAGRVLYPVASRHTGVRQRTLLILIATALTIALLGLLTTAFALTVAAIVAGMARGLKTLIHATAITDRWGTAHYGRLSGLMSAPITIAVALGPWAGAALAGLLDSYSAAFLVLAGVALISVGFAALSVPRAAPSTLTHDDGDPRGI